MRPPIRLLLLQDLLRSRIRERGPLTMAAFMDLALYHPEAGYYNRTPYPPAAADDLAGDADATRMLADLLARQLVTFAHALGPSGSPFTVIDAGAGDGRLSHGILRALHAADPQLCGHTHLHLIERSASARHAQRTTLAAWTDHALGGDALPDEFEGVVVAKELLSALPAHLLVMRRGELREIHVDDADGQLTAVEAAASSPLLTAHVRDSGLVLTEGAHVATSPAALDWVGDAARRLRRGFILVIDRAGNAGDLSSSLARPGETPIAAHVDFAGVRRVAEQEGCITARFTDQTAFLVALTGHLASGFTDAERRAFTALTHPAGPASAMRVLMLVKNVNASPGESS